MKNTIIILSTLFLFILGTTTSQSQNSYPKKNNYLILSKNIQQLKPILLTAKELAKEDGKKYGDFYVIICGKTVNNIENNTDFISLLEKTTLQHIKVFVCGISLNNSNISADQIPSNLEITDNGILYGFQLIKKGFISLTI
ncbi:sulfur reduction protein DsrE [Pseudalgibacter alginicilyticus]|uniref:Sulfur reduction protein DsrE n=1 Tax=Pseudalgibacter alginicilyticus TaxID=1736674 RepID=A0A0P0CJR2_9FLAO|nr:hypothetical protein [Pseudalgibacter alginicilyticus]ALJ04617.1 sulfur reduction protein DsrE [Pseudalgibacter alginicilyticus]